MFGRASNFIPVAFPSGRAHMLLVRVWMRKFNLVQCFLELLSEVVSCPDAGIKAKSA